MIILHGIPFMLRRAKCCSVESESCGEETAFCEAKRDCKKVEDGIEETLTYCTFSVVSIFPDGNSALMLVCTQLRYVADTQWGNKST